MVARFRRVLKTADPATAADLADARTLPRLLPAAVRVLNRLLGSGIGSLAVRHADYRLHWLPDPRQAADDVRYVFKLGGQPGLLQLDAVSEATLLGDRLARGLPQALRQLLVAEALQQVADRLEAALGQSFEWTAETDAPSPAPRPQVGIAFELQPAAPEAAPLRGALLFADAAALERMLPANLPGAPALTPLNLDRLRQPLAWLIGSTTLTLAELRRIGRGDIVSVERWTPQGPGLHVTARWGGRRGRVLHACAEGTRLTIQELKDDAMNRDAHALPADEAGEAATPLPLDRLDGLEVALRFEIGELTLTLGELRSLRPGQVLDLAQPLNRCPVRLLAHGNLLGHGHLVAVGERLGVRVAEFAPSAI